MESSSNSRHLARIYARTTILWAFLNWLCPYLLRTHGIYGTKFNLVPQYNQSYHDTMSRFACKLLAAYFSAIFHNACSMYVLRKWNILTLPCKLYYLLCTRVSTTHTFSSWDMQIPVHPEVLSRCPHFALAYQLGKWVWYHSWISWSDDTSGQHALSLE